MSLDVIICSSIAPASIIDISGTSTDAVTEANTANPTKLTPINRYYTVFKNAIHSVTRKATSETSVKSWSISKFLMLSYNHPNLFSNVYL